MQTHIEGELSEIEVRLSRQGNKPQLGSGQRVVLITLSGCLRFSAPNEGHHCGENFAVLRIATEAAHLVMDVLAEFEHALHPAVDAEDDFRPARSEIGRASCRERV